MVIPMATPMICLAIVMITCSQFRITVGKGTLAERWLSWRKSTSCHTLACDVGHGTCVDEDQCQCGQGYTGADCSTRCTGEADPTNYQCESTTETCFGPETDVCSACSSASCNPSTQICVTVDNSPGCLDCPKPSCIQDHGVCAVKDTGSGSECKCFYGWTGETCGVECPDPRCVADQGECVATSNGRDSKCSCYDGYTGTTCSLVCPEHCARGACYADSSDTAAQCRECEEGWTGAYCQIECPDNCGDNYQCVQDPSGFEESMCDCDDTHTGEDCNTLQCNDVNLMCQNGGVCNYDNECTCPEGYSGDFCNMAEGTIPDIFLLLIVNIGFLLMM